MESESSHSLPNPSETPNTPESETNEISTSRKRTRAASTKPPKIPKQPRSPYWGHCQRGTRKLSDGSLEEIGICNYCKAEIPVTYGSTSGLKTHLVRRCKSSPLYEESLSEKTQQILTSESMGQGSTLVSHMFNQKRSELKVAEWVIVDEMSFRAVEGKGFVSLVRELQPRFRIPGRKKIAGLNAIQESSLATTTNLT